MEQNTVAVFTDLAYRSCIKVVNDKKTAFVLHDEQRLQNCLTRFVEAYNITAEHFFSQRTDGAKVVQNQ